MSAIRHFGVSASVATLCYAFVLDTARAQDGCRFVNIGSAAVHATTDEGIALDDGRVVPAFVAQALAGKDFTVFGDGSQTRSFCYASDLVDGFVRLALSDVQDPVNLGNPEEMTILQFAEAVRAAAGGGGRIVHLPLPKDDPQRRRPDITRARQLLGWEPRTTLSDGLKQTIAYFRGVPGVTARAGEAGRAHP